MSAVVCLDLSVRDTLSKTTTDSTSGIPAPVFVWNRVTEGERLAARNGVFGEPWPCGSAVTFEPALRIKALSFLDPETDLEI